MFQFTPGEDRPSLDLRFSTDGDVFPDGVRSYRAIPVSTSYPAGVRVEGR